MKRVRPQSSSADCAADGHFRLTSTKFQLQIILPTKLADLFHRFISVDLIQISAKFSAKSKINMLKNYRTDQISKRIEL